MEYRKSSQNYVDLFGENSHYLSVDILAEICFEKISFRTVAKRSSISNTEYVKYIM